MAGITLKIRDVVTEKIRLNPKVVQEKRGFKGVKAEIRCMTPRLRSHPTKLLIKATVRLIAI
jgi:hypothetical protein